MKNLLKEQNIARLNFVSMLMIIALLSFCMGYLFISSYYHEFKAEIKHLEKDYIYLEKEKIKEFVNNKIRFLHIQNSQVETLQKQELKESIYAIHNVATTIYDIYSRSRTEDEIKKIVKNALSTQRSNTGLTYFLINEADIIEPLLKNIKTENKVLIEKLLTRSKSEKFNRFLKKAKTRWEGFYDLSADQVEEKRASSKNRLLFIKRFEVFDWFIGAVGDSDNVIERLRKGVINNYRFLKENKGIQENILIYEILQKPDKGQMSDTLVQPIFNGLADSNRPHGLNRQVETVFMRKNLKTLREKSEGFIEHHYLNPETELQKTTIFFYKQYPAWNWIVASLFFFEDLKKTHTQNITELERKTRNKIRTAVFLFLIFIGVAIAVSLVFSRGIAKIFGQYKQRVEYHNKQLSLKNKQLLTEIAERKLAEESLRNSQERLRMLTSEIQLTEERERRRIATDLHDSVGPLLAVSNLKLEMLSSRIHKPELESELAVVHQQIKEVINQTRSLTFQLSPPILYKLGLEAPLASLAEQTQNHQGIKTVFEDDHQSKELPEDVRIHLFRSVRELIVNTIKYAKAEHIYISVSRENDQISVKVTDDGVGFEFSEIGRSQDGIGGFGLFSIQERLRLLGGQLNVITAPGKGTDVILKAPIQPAVKSS